MSERSAVTAGRVLVVGTSSRTADATTTLADVFPGRSLLVASTTTGALERLESVTVDCVVCDVDGDESISTIDALRTFDPELPIVALLSDDDDPGAAIDSGASDIVWPDDPPAVVVTRVNNAVDRSKRRQQSASESGSGSEREPKPELDSDPGAKSSSESPFEPASSALLEHSEALVFVFDDEGMVRYASPSVETQIGYTPDELERSDLSRFVHPDDSERILETVRDVASMSLGSSQNTTLRLGYADGSWHVSAMTITNRLEDPAIEGLVGTITDGSPSSVSVSTSSGDDLQESTVPIGHANALERLSSPFFALDEQWALTTVNDAARDLFVGPERGTQPTESDSDVDSAHSDPAPDSSSSTTSNRDLAGTVVWELLPESVSATMYERLHEAVTTDSVVAFESTYPPLETAFEFHAYPDETGVSVYAHELESTSQSEREGLFESIVDSLEESVLVLDGRTIDFANAAAFDRFEVETLVGRTIDELFDTDVAERIGERAESTMVRRTDPIDVDLASGSSVRDLPHTGSSRSETPTQDSSQPVSISVAPLPGDDRVVCVVRDATARIVTRRTLSRLRETTRDGREVTTRSAVCRAVVAACVEALDVRFGCAYLFDDGVFRPAALTVPDESAPDSSDLPVFDTTDTSGDVGSHLFTEILEQDGAVVRSEPDFDALLARLGVGGESHSIVTAPLGTHGLVLLSSHRSVPVDHREVVDTFVAVGVLALERVALDSTLRTRDRKLDETADSLERLETLTDRMRRIERVIREATTRSALERGVCDELAAIDWLSFVWIGEATAGTNDISPRAWAGTHETYLDDLALDRERPLEPTERALDTSSSVHVSHITTDDPSLEWSTPARERGFRSVFAVPLAYDEYVYGVLSMYTTEASQFDEQTRSIVQNLGETIAYAINGVETKRALLADSVTRLEFSLGESDDVLSTIVRRAGAQLSIQAVVPKSDDQSTVFVTADGEAGARVQSIASELDSIESVRVIGDQDQDRAVGGGGSGSDSERDNEGDADDQGRSNGPNDTHSGGTLQFELVVTESTLASIVGNHGGVLRSIDVADGQTRFVADLPHGNDVRAFVHMLDRKYPGTDLLARRERDHSTRTRGDFRSVLADRLTERQLRTLETAYYSGFFEWPRERTGEEVAELLDISQPTFNRHFRMAEQKLFSLLFDQD